MEYLILIIVLVFSAILHEVMHGYVADRLGDPTARLMGRLTLNPIPHIDPFASILIPIILILSGSPIIFGAAKPVPVNPLNLREGRKDMALVGLAGPATNMVLAITAAALLNFLPIASIPILGVVLFSVVQINVVLAILNLIPIPPLDGSRVFSIILPDEFIPAYYSLEPYGIFILFFLLLFPLGPFSLGSLLNTLVVSAMHLLGL